MVTKDNKHTKYRIKVGFIQLQQQQKRLKDWNNAVREVGQKWRWSTRANDIFFTSRLSSWTPHESEQYPIADDSHSRRWRGGPVYSEHETPVHPGQDT